jgi:hypothetical protein
VPTCTIPQHHCKGSPGAVSASHVAPMIVVAANPMIKMPTANIMSAPSVLSGREIIAVILPQDCAKSATSSPKSLCAESATSLRRARPAPQHEHMSTRPRSQAGPPLTLGNMRANGARSFAVLCWTCRGDAVLPIAVLMSRDCHASHVADVHPGAAMGFEIERKFLLRGSRLQPSIRISGKRI